MSSVAAERAAKESVQIASLCRAYQTHGHLMADVDPLELKTAYKGNESIASKYHFPDQKLLKLLDYKNYGFTEQDLDREFYIHSIEKGSIRDQKRTWKLRDLLTAYRTAYCEKIGVEFMHIPKKEVCDWIRTNFEGIQYNRLSKEEHIHLYERLNWSA